ncbi:cytochrome c biogenesis protein CcsA [Myroides odoratimimus]|uniref:cytochrome c biogenesis protein CcsA n=1 Tax=Myroides odoratimimus TaxID=76832 RepID=UPI0025762E3A|nr:cytochrome c biogenesis protein CcsA [Myroides odoratimimus]MDM1093862.1 cytochrome c biogenesis protein CcsA [Myroides odoratimimus]MDM1326547.1 cytochrome c biogenesis protein CcsA [Myroides odoratimimus]MDM1453759.1 cytochrome c biogenesis protein CcsA [Myroides odoratimimus]MDM1477481.1 cytochrome c biogenesis protein CcsA [Myroides odoratimimus]MDM1489699.1 cytochrome c biogenesis protein CcsA [Myroides odoratimimus]
MDKKIISFFSSTRLMAVLFIVYAVALALGTFIEDRYNTTTARILIYNTKWFEFIMFVFLINFIGNIKKYRLLSKEKWATLMLHAAFILILLGAFITRYISFEGMMPIREGETADSIFSDKTFLTVMTDGEYEGEQRRRTYERPILFSPVTNNHFKVKEDFNGIGYEIEYKDFIMGATEAIAEDPNGKMFLKLVESGDGDRHEHFLEEGKVVSIHNVLFSLNKPTDGAINITKEGDEFFIDTPFGGTYMVMATQATGDVVAGTKAPLNFRSLYNMAGTQFVIPEMPIKGKMVLESDGDFKNKRNTDALVLTVRSQGKEEEVTLMGKAGRMGEPQSFKLGDLEFTMMYGSKVYTTPFQIKLNKFIAEKYPGTESSYASFESQVTVLDGAENFDARIYMNNILDYKGYRFFQAEFDRDEKGTILSVNHDFWGTWITYIGYFLLYVGLIVILFDKNTRFGDLKRKLDKVREKKASILTMLFLFLSVGAFAQHNHETPTRPNQVVIDSLIKSTAVDKEHAARFGELVIQDFGGRMKPVNTFASELLRKVYKGENYKGLNPDQVFLSMTQFTVAQQLQGAPNYWYYAELIKLPRGNDKILEALKLPKDAKYAAFIDFFDEDGNYRLAKVVEDANHSAVKNQFEKDYLDLDSKMALLNAAFTTRSLTIFPIPGHDNDKWVSPLELNEAGLKGMDSTFTKSILPRMYVPALFEAKQSGNYAKADEFLQSIKTYQNAYGKTVIPSEKKIQFEIQYNKYDIFKTLYSYYMLAAVFLFIFIISEILKPRRINKTMIKIGSWATVLLFGIHTLGLAVRWYVSGHAPWSDAYESVIYVAWATTLFGLLFGRKSELTIASTAFVAAIVLWGAHLNFMDPAIGNLQPVLNSYWLIIHVAVIVGSYGPFTLGMILGVVTLFLMILTNDKNKKKMDLNIKELTYINEMTLTVGLVLLTIGNFLGGQWANESWGRYWGWDPKETWALISIMIYAFVIHARLVPAMRGTWLYNVFSVVAYYSIMMTYFGVNFYLSGLHSYASGDKVITPTVVWWSLGFVIVLSVFSYIKYKKYLKK